MSPDSVSSEMSANDPELDIRGSHVLVVDDNRDIRRILHRILSRQGYRLSEAADGDEGLELARREQPDLVLLDVMMPKKNGIEVCRALKGDPATRNIRVILVTGRASVDHCVEGFEAGADDYVRKPFQVPELLARTATFLRMKALTDHLEERNRQLVKSQSDLVRSEKMATIGLLASGVAHEFNNILGGIAAYAQLASRDRAYAEEFVRVTLTQAERAMDLTRSLATYNQHADDHATCDPCEVVQDCIRLLHREVETRSVRVVSDIAENLGHVGIGAAKLQEVILNLMINALHAVDRGTGLIRISLEHGEAPGSVVLRVADNGCGVARENRIRIFDPFFTTKGPRGSDEETGTGLGLSVSYNIVQSCGGTIELVDEDDREGATFAVVFPPPSPAALEASGKRPARSTRKARVAKPLDRPLRIVVVDDDAATRDCLHHFLRAHNVECCSRLEPAIEACAIDPFDYAIVDLYLQGRGDTMSSLTRFQQLESPPRVILTSGRPPTAEHESLVRAAHGFLAKPFQLESLAELMGLTFDQCHSPESVAQLA